MLQAHDDNRATCFDVVLPSVLPSSSFVLRSLPAPALHAICDVAAAGGILTQAKRVQRFMKDKGCCEARIPQLRESGAHANQSAAGGCRQERAPVPADWIPAPVDEHQALDQSVGVKSEAVELASRCAAVGHLEILEDAGTTRASKFPDGKVNRQSNALTIGKREAQCERGLFSAVAPSAERRTQSQKDDDHA
jgi:hypothetical protein